MDEDYKKQAVEGKVKKDDIAEQIMGASSLMKGELELNGRRMVVMPSVARTDVDTVIAGNAEAKLKAS